MAHPKSPNGYRLGIVNPLTLVGNEIKTILRERAFPFDKVALLDSTGAAAGALTEVGDEPTIVTPISDIELEDLDLVFFCGPAAGNREWIARHAEDDFIAIDLSQPSTAEDGRLAIAGLNLDELGADEVLVSPHPAAIPIALILHQIESLSPMSIQPVPKTIFDRQLAFNLYPALERNEEFIIAQVRALTDPRAELALLITQGTIFHGHTFSLFVKTQDPLDAERITEALRANPALALPEGDQQVGTIDAAGKDEVLIAEVRSDVAIPNGFWVWAVCDNLRRSSALNAVLVAEKALFGADAIH